VQVISPNWTTVRLFLHVLAACVWVGGQLTLGGLVPALRSISPQAPRIVARQFNRIAWPAFAVLIATGLWNLLVVNVSDRPTSYLVTLFVKLLIVAVSGISAAAHAGAKTKLALALGGALAGLSGLAALFLGILLRTG